MEENIVLLEEMYLNEDDEDIYFLSVMEDDGGPDKLYIDCLRKNFGHKNFRSNQFKIISSIIKEKRDVCAVMATGYGKSLCYQFPSVYMNSLTIVVSPLISLMEDQVLSLQMLNIKACLLGTAQKDKSIINNVMNNEFRLVYLTPEFITGDLGEKLLKNLASKISLIAIDEAHCISKWGHDFRKSFSYLGRIRKIIPNVPILAMTATATEQIQNDIIASLGLRNPLIICTGFDRPNLEFNVRHKSSSKSFWNDVGGILQAQRTGSVIIYCLTRNESEEICGVIRSHGVTCEQYHAGLSLTRRKEIHRKFVRDEIQIIVATIAFGMGIDKPDVRCVIHYGACQDIESYYQEVGRAGRDGMPAKCFLFYNSKDFEFHKFMREKSQYSREVIENLEKLSDRMYEYLSITSCRRVFILQYFEGDKAKILHVKNKNTCCDNCRNNENAKNRLTVKYQNLDENGFYDFTKDAEILLGAIKVFNGYCGLQTPILFLHGSKDKKLAQKHYSHPLYGAGKEKSKEWWKSVGDLLIFNKYLEKKMQKSWQQRSFTSFTVGLTQQGQSWLNNTTKTLIKLKLPQHMLRFLKSEKLQLNVLEDVQNSNSSSNSGRKDPKNVLAQFEMKIKTKPNQELMKVLHKVRISLASRLDVMPYMIISNKAILQMADKKPVTLDELTKYEIDGFSEVKIKEFGPHFIKCIREFEGFQSHDNISNEKQDMIDEKENEESFVEVQKDCIDIVERNSPKVDKTDVEDILDTDMNIDFEELDKTIEKANYSVKEEKLEGNDEKFEITSAIIPKVNDESIPVASPLQKPTSSKRKICYATKSNKTVYENSSDDDNNDNQQDNSVKRRNVPEWLSVPSQSSKANTKKKATPRKKIF